MLNILLAFFPSLSSWLLDACLLCFPDLCLSFSCYNLSSYEKPPLTMWWENYGYCSRIFLHICLHHLCVLASKSTEKLPTDFHVLWLQEAKVRLNTSKEGRKWGQWVWDYFLPDFFSRSLGIAVSPNERSCLLHRFFSEKLVTALFSFCFRSDNGNICCSPKSASPSSLSPKRKIIL